MKNQNSYFSKRTIIHNDVKYEHPVRTIGAVSIKADCIIDSFTYINSNTTIKTRLRRYLDNLYTSNEGTNLLNEMCDPKNRETVDELSTEIWDEYHLDDSESEERREQYRNEARRLVRRIHKTILFRLRSFAISAAAVAAILLVSVFGYYFYNQSCMQTTYSCVATSYGEHRTVVLPDGTNVCLNSCSRLIYPDKFVGKSRNVKLTGEAFFKVVHNEKLPFSVSTGHFNVKVLGTQFNVKSYPDDEVESVRVKSGKVQVDLPDAMMRIVSKEEVVINALSGEYAKRSVKSNNVMWLDDTASLYFNSTPIRDVARVLERLYHCNITFAKGQKFDNIISGAHDNTSLRSILQSIEFISGIHYKMKGNEVLLYH